MNEDQPNKQRLLFRSCYIARELAIITCILEETQWQAEEEEKSFIVEKRGSFGCALTEAVGMGKPQVG